MNIGWLPATIIMRIEKIFSLSVSDATFPNPTLVIRLILMVIVILIVVMMTMVIMIVAIAMLLMVTVMVTVTVRVTVTSPGHTGHGVIKCCHIHRFS